MTKKQKVFITLGISALALTAGVSLWLIVGRSGTGKHSDAVRAFAAESGDCAGAVLSLFDRGEWETAGFVPSVCGAAADESRESRVREAAEAIELFRKTISGWSPPWPDPEGNVSATLSPVEAEGRIAQAQKIIEDYPRTSAAGLAKIVQALLLYYLGRHAECASLLDGGGISEASPELTALLRVMALARAGLNTEAEDAADKFLRELGEHPGAFNAGEIKLWKARALAAEGRLQSASELALRVASDPEADRFTRGRALHFTAELYGANGDGPSRVRLLVAIARNFPEVDIESDLDADFDDESDVPILTLEQRIALAVYFLAKERGFPVHRFLYPVKDSLSDGNLMLLARGEFLAGKYKTAKELLDALRKKNIPVEIRSAACILGARIFIRTEKYDSAVSALGGCIANYPAAEAEALEYLAKTYEFSGKEDLRIKTLMRMTETEPSRAGNDDAYLRIARWMFAAGRKDKARAAYAAIAAGFPESPAAAEAVFWVSRMALDGGDNAAAEAGFRKIQKQFPYSYFNFRSGQYLAKMGLPDESLNFPPLSIDDLVPPENARIRYANALLRLNLFDQAAHEYEIAGEKAPNEAAAGIARVLLAKNQLPLSTKAIEARAAADPDFYRRIMADGSLTTLLFPRFYEQNVTAEAAKYGMDPVWLLAVIRQESRFDPNARSSSNAIGLMQIIPSTGQWIAERLGAGGFKEASLYDVDTNIAFGTWYFDYLTKKFGGNYILATAAYNGGPGNVGRWIERFGASDIDLFIERIPRDETRSYTKKVMLNYFVYSWLLGREKRDQND